MLRFTGTPEASVVKIAPDSAVVGGWATPVAATARAKATAATAAMMGILRGIRGSSRGDVDVARRGRGGARGWGVGGRTARSGSAGPPPIADARLVELQVAGPRRREPALTLLHRATDARLVEEMGSGCEPAFELLFA